MQPAADSRPDLNEILINLDTFSRLPANTDVHCQNGRFIITGGAYSAIRGVQAIVNRYHGHDSAALNADLLEFLKKITKIAEDICLTKSNQAVYNPTLLPVLHRAFTKALGTHSGAYGLYGLLETNKGDQLFSQIRKKLDSVKENLATLDDDGRNDDTGFPYCPETTFSDEDWECAMATARQFQPESFPLIKYYAKFCVGLLFTQAMNASGQWDAWNEIGDENIILGYLPLKSDQSDDATALKSLGVKAVLSVVEVVENHASGIIHSAVTPEDWCAKGIKQLQLPTPDFETISLEDVLRGVEFIRWNIKNNRKVYVHCKAGRGRSALILMCYLIKYSNHTADSALAFVREYRKQAGFKEKDPKMKTLRTFEAAFRSQEEEKN